MAAIQQTFAFLQTKETAEATSARNHNQAALPHTPAPQLPNSSSPPLPPDRSAILRQLRAQVRCVSTAATDTVARLSTGCQAMDAMLPGGGLRRNAIAEWVAQSDSSGAAALSLISVATYLHLPSNSTLPVARGPIVVVDLDKTFYPPAAVALGIPMEQIILVRPRQHAEMVWAIDQALRCEAVAAVWACVGARLDDRDARRFQLAAEQSNTPGFLVRPQAVRGRPSFADVRLHVASQPVHLNPKRERGMQDAGFRLADASGDEKIRSGTRQEFRQRGQNAESLGDFRYRKTENALPKSPHRLLQVTLDRCRGGVIGQHVYVHIDDQAQLHHVSFNPSVRHETAAVPLASQLANPTAAQSTDRGKRTA